jgi:predicted RNase H-like HicB family nuclease
MKYAVIYEKTGTGYSAYVPDLPGCITTGRTRKETERLMKEAIEFHLAGMREDGLSVPESTTTVKKAPGTLAVARTWDGRRAHRAVGRPRRIQRKRRA